MKYFLLGLLMFWVAGCKTTEVRVITHETLVVSKVSEIYTKEVELPQPPDIQAFQEMSLDEREDALTRLTLALYSRLQEFLTDRRLLRQQLTEQEAAVLRHNEAETLRIQQLKQQLEKAP